MKPLTCFLTLLPVLAAAVRAGETPPPDDARAELVRQAIHGDAASRQQALARLRAADPLPAAEIERWKQAVWAEVNRRPRADGERLRDERRPLRYRLAGTPQRGGPLLIYLHGGGRTTPGNDYGWEAAGRTSRFQGFPCTLLPRTLNDESVIGWCESDSYLALEELLRELVRTHGFDTNRIYLGGSSMGGYGTCLVGPLLADRCAALFAEAGAAAFDLEANLRNTPLAIQLGGQDPRLEVGRELAALLGGWRAEEGDGYEVLFREYPGAGHNLPMSAEREVGDWLRTKTRDPAPRTVVWTPRDPELNLFYWLGLGPEGFREERLRPAPRPAATPGPQAGRPAGGEADEDGDDDDDWEEDEPAEVPVPLRAELREGNSIALTGGRPGIRLFLNRELVDLARPLTVTLDGQPVFQGLAQPSLAALVESISAKEDPELVYTHLVELPAPPDRPRPAAGRPRPRRAPPAAENSAAPPEDEAEAGEEEAGAGGAGATLPDVAESPDWRVETDLGRAEAGQMLRQLEGLRACFLAEFALTPRPPPAGRKPAVSVYRTVEEYQRLVPRPEMRGHSGYYDPETNHCYFSPFAIGYSTLLHEATHLLAHNHLAGGAAEQAGQPGYWVQEGVAAYFESFRFDAAGRGEAGNIVEHRRDNLLYLRLGIAQAMLDSPRWVPLARFASLNEEEYRALTDESKTRSWDIYSEGAALFHYLRHAENGRYREAVGPYLRDSLTGRAAADGFNRHLGVTAEELEPRLQAWLRALPLEDGEEDDDDDDDDFEGEDG